MVINIARGKKDKVIEKIITALKKFEKENASAQIDIYRQSPVSIRIRIVDPVFDGMSKANRHERVWKFFETLPEEIQGDISMLVLLAPGEEKSSFSNMEFDDPVPSGL